eukprot:403349390
MSNKQQAVLLFLHYTNQDNQVQSIEGLYCSEALNLQVKEGNSQLLVLRKDITEQQDESQKQIELFNALTCLSQIEGPLMQQERELNNNFQSNEETKQPSQHQSVIEKNFFKLELVDNKYENMFHNGGLTSMIVVSNSQVILSQAQKYNISTQEFEEENLQTLVESSQSLKFIYLVDPIPSLVDKILTSFQSQEALSKQQLLKYVGIYPQPIKRHHILPKRYEFIDDIIPKQTYLSVGSMNLDLEKDIAQDQAILLIECDIDYQRLDKYESLDQIQKELDTAEANPFVYKYQLADTFMRNIAFKLGKLEKFGA